MTSNRTADPTKGLPSAWSGYPENRLGRAPSIGGPRLPDVGHRADSRGYAMVGRCLLGATRPPGGRRRRQCPKAHLVRPSVGSSSLASTDRRRQWA